MPHGHRRKMLSMTRYSTILLLLIVHSAQSQQNRATVYDISNGEPIRGAVVQFTTNANTITDQNGVFYFDENGPAVISHLGYDQKEVELSNENGPLQIGLEAGIFNLNEVVVTAYHDNRKLIDTPGPIALISKKDLQRDQDLIFTNTINRVPGVFMHSGALNTNRITIRGIGSRSLFSTNRVRGYLNDIPLTTGEGETTLEDIDLGLVDRIEVIRGPASSELGAGLGGAINLKTARTKRGQSRITTNNQIGSYGLYRTVNTADIGFNSGSLKLIATNTESDGYRENNEYDRRSFAIIGEVNSEDTEISLLLNYIDLKAFIPSSLNDSTFRANPRAAASNWLAARGFEDYTRLYLGSSINHRLTAQSEISLSLFSSFRNSNEVRPFNVLRENTNAIGIRSKYTHEFQGQWAPVVVIGFESFRDNHIFSTHENDSLQILSDNDEVRKYYNYFVQGDWQLNDKWSFVAGANINKTTYDYEDLFRIDGDQSGDFGFDAIFSPRFAVNYKPTPNNAFHATVSHGFAPPTLAETLTPDGQINPAIQPETGYNYEVGSRGSLMNSRFNYDLTLFTMRIKNLLVARRVADDQFVGVNAGKTTHTGVELALGYELFSQPTGFLRNLNAHFNYTLADYNFDQFVDGDDDFSGNELTGTPKNTINGIIDFKTSIGFYGNVNYRFVDEMPMRDDNSIFSNSYQLTNVKVGFERTFGKFGANLYGGINNLFDEHYAAMILVNASSFGGAPPRYFYPGQDRNYFGGLSLSLML